MKQMSGAILKLVPLGSLRIAGIILAFVQSICLARFFGAETFGILAVAMSSIAIVGLVFSFGLNEFLMREIAARTLAKARVDPQVHGFLQLTARIIFPTALGITALGAVLFGWFGMGGVYSIAFLVVTGTYLIRVLRQFTEAFAVAAKKQTLSILGSKIAYPSIMILGTLVMFATGLSFTTSGVLVLYCVAMAGSTVVAFSVVRPEIRTLFSDAPTAVAPSVRKVLWPAILMGAVMSANLIILHMDTILIGALAAPEEAAYARVGQKLAESIGLILVIAMIHYRPLLAEAHGQGQREVLAHHVETLTKLLTLFGLLSFLVVVGFADYLILLFGAEYSSAVPAMRAYAVGALALMLAGPGTLLLMMTANEVVASRILWFVVLCNLVLDLIAIPYLGALGAGLATAVSQVLLAVLTVRACRGRTGLDPSFLSLVGRARA